jgi:PAS domain S-box-containing protein
MDSSTTTGNQDNQLNKAIQLISVAQNQGLEVENPDHQYVKMMKEFFGADAAVLHLIDPEDPQKVTKKELGKASEWKIIVNLDIDKGILNHCYKSAEIFQETNVNENPLYLSAFDGVKEIEPKSLVCTPIVSHSISFGTIGLINTLKLLDNQDFSLLALFASKLADHLFYSKLLRESETTSDELKTSRLQLLHSRNTLRTLFDNIPESFYIVDRKYTITALNQSRANRTGQKPKDLVGRTCHEVLFGLNIPCPGCLVAKTYQTSSPTRRFRNLWMDERDNSEYEITTYPILDSDGSTQQVILLEQDITDKRKLEAELIQSEKLAAVGQLAAGVAHEINNPLTAVIANAQMLIQDISPDQTELMESAKLIEMAGIRANQVVKNLLGLVRKEESDFEPVDLNESIQSALMLVSHEFISRQITITFNRVEKIPSIIASANYLQGVWINLLMNSIEAIGSEKGEIKIGLHYEAGNFYVEFKDTGPGITDANLGRIFEPFFTTKQSGQGTGLGLSLVRRVIQAHGGQILVESSPGEGARFTIILPENGAKLHDKGELPELGLI